MEKIPQREMYLHPEIGALEADATRLVEKLKIKIDQGFYTLLVSDETGGRLPTLLIRSIIKKRHPDSNLQTLFLNGGKMLQALIDDEKPDEEASFVDYIQMVTEEHQNALVITQVMHSGSSLAILASMLKQSGCDHVDAATLRAGFSEMIYDSDKKRFGDGEIFIGKEFDYTHEFDERNAGFSGVVKVKDSVVHPHSTKEIGNKTEEEEHQIQILINEAREDIKTMSDLIYKKVWNEEGDPYL